jgi:redox-sensitive bicupin YhaK (pirin superfamily)
MTAGGGILHEEMPRRGPDGVIDGFQLWVNLPAAQKMIQPRYQGVIAADIPVAKGPGWQARVVAGKVSDISGPVTEIAADPLYLEVAMLPNAEFDLVIPDTHTVIAYVFDGQATFGEQEVVAVKLVVFGQGNQIKVKTGDKTVRFMLMAGAPIGEPIVPYGPFVMNTRAEIEQALVDLRNGTFVWTQHPV